MKKINIILLDFLMSALLLIVAVMSVSCSSDEPKEPGTALRTVLVYMVADNNLSGYGLKDIGEMKQGMRASKLPEGYRWIVYHSGKDGNPKLIEIDNLGNEIILAEYTDGESSVSISRMRSVIEDTKRLAESNEYGLVLWSHGTGWLSESGSLSVDDRDGAVMMPLSFGNDGVHAYRMKISSLAEALSGNDFDFIYFDCCHMATVEVAYELRGVTDEVVASATELGVDGMPYEKNVVPLLSGDCYAAAQNTFGFYADRYAAGSDYGCSISLLNLKAINSLAESTRQVLARNSVLPSDYVPVKYFRRLVVPEGMYDFKHYVNALCGDDAALYQQWLRRFNDVVKYHSTTRKVYGLDASQFAGLASNIIFSPEEIEPQNDKYKYRETAWWADVVSTVFR